MRNLSKAICMFYTKEMDLLYDHETLLSSRILRIYSIGHTPEKLFKDQNLANGPATN